MKKRDVSMPKTNILQLHENPKNLIARLAQKCSAKKKKRRLEKHEKAGNNN